MQPNYSVQLLCKSGLSEIRIIYFFSIQQRRHARHSSPSILCKMSNVTGWKGGKANNAYHLHIQQRVWMMQIMAEFAIPSPVRELRDFQCTSNIDQLTFLGFRPLQSLTTSKHPHNYYHGLPPTSSVCRGQCNHRDCPGFERQGQCHCSCLVGHDARPRSSYPEWLWLIMQQERTWWRQPAVGVYCRAWSDQLQMRNISIQVRFLSSKDYTDMSRLTRAC